MIPDNWYFYPLSLSGNPAFDNSLDAIDETLSEEDDQNGAEDPEDGREGEFERSIAKELPSAQQREKSKRSK